MRQVLTLELENALAEIREIVRSYGLDCFDVIFEMVDYDEINEIAAMGGFPTRYPHWRFGMEYDYLSKSAAYGLQKIYELVINTDPCYAYLQIGNTMVDQKLVMAHVHGHCDFFKNNMYFSKTNRKMLDQMANNASRIRRYQDLHGVEEVENFIDSCLSIDDLIDPYSMFAQLQEQAPSDLKAAAETESEVGKIKSKLYMDSYVNPDHFIESQRDKIKKMSEADRKLPPCSQRDILKYLIEYSPLEPWEREILNIVREEAYYFAPQAQTKIMNEGWASYWHSRIMTQHVLRDAEVIDYADHNAGVMGSTPGQINPYKLGVELYRDIEERWNRGKFGADYENCDDVTEKKRWDRNLGQGREKIFEVRKLHNDVTFVDSFMNEEFAEAQKLFTYAYNRRTGMYEIVDRDWRKVKEKLLASLSNFGRPIIEIEDGNFENRGELLLKHRHEGIDLEYDKAVDTLRNIMKIWRRPVNILTKFNGQGKIISVNEKEVKEKDVA